MNNSRRNRVGTNQYKIKKHKPVGYYLLGFVFVMDLLAFLYLNSLPTTILNPSVEAASTHEMTSSSASVIPITQQLQPTPTPSELEDIVSYITRVFEPEGKDVVVRAINCFYSESGLRENAVGYNTDIHQSIDYGVAQLNGYWQNLTSEEKTNYKANIDKAYEIYKGRGNNFEAWYGKLCNE